MVDFDVSKTINLFSKNKKCINYSKFDRLYYSSNENYEKIISGINGNDKRVLTVLGSGDQVIDFYKNGFRDIDVFDINRLTIYYFYLRMWCIKYNNCAYPDFNFDNRFIKKILSKIDIKSSKEADAYQYWSVLNNLVSDYSRLFYPSYEGYINKDIDISSIRNMIDNFNFNFYDFDISNNIDLNKKYDVVYTSNIGDYLKEKKFRKYVENVYNLLDKNGSLYYTAYYSRVEMEEAELRKYFKKNRELDRESGSNFSSYTCKKRYVKRPFVGNRGK